MSRQLYYLVAATLLTLLMVGGVQLLGPAGIFLNLFAATPVVFVAVRAGFKAGLATVLLVTGVLQLVNGSASALPYLVQYGGGALLLAALLLRNRGWDRAVAFALGGTLLLSLLLLSAYALYQGSDIFTLANGIVQGEIDRSLATLPTTDLTPEQMAEMKQLMEQVGTFLRQAWPALTVVFGGLTLLLAVALLANLRPGGYVLPGVDFAAWKSPEVLIWPFIAAGFIYFFTNGWPAVISLNLLVLLLPLYFLQGLAIISHFFRLKAVAPWLRNLGYVMAVLLNPLPIIVTFVGLFDLWVDFRKPRTTNT
ncbi:MAG TPA: hypothetical protein DCF93_07900 [Desulfuromonas sp.]|nr:hypothetical protein [Desulfuromonas sp.]